MEPILEIMNKRIDERALLIGEVNARVISRKKYAKRMKEADNKAVNDTLKLMDNTIQVYFTCIDGECRSYPNDTRCKECIKEFRKKLAKKRINST